MGGGLAFHRGELKEKYARKAWEREVEFHRLEKKKRDARIKKRPRYDIIAKDTLFSLYITEKKSIREIAAFLGFSTHKISYWLLKYNIRVRNNSDAVYVRKHADKNHFPVRPFHTSNSEFLSGVGCGVYWGGGVMSEKTPSLKLSSEDPKLLNFFIYFIRRAYGVKKSEMRISVRIRESNNMHGVIEYWMRELKVPRSQFQKKIETFQYRGISKGRNAKYGVATVYIHDRKFKKNFLEAIKNISF